MEKIEKNAKNAIFSKIDEISFFHKIVPRNFKNIPSTVFESLDLVFSENIDLDQKKAFLVLFCNQNGNIAISAGDKNHKGNITILVTKKNRLCPQIHNIFNIFKRLENLNALDTPNHTHS